MDAAVLRVVIAREEGVFTVRRRARDVAGLVGFDAQDQVRVATALGEIGREALAWWGSALVTFSLRTAAPAALRIRIQAAPSTEPGPRPLPPPAESTGLAAARRLMDELANGADEERGPPEVTMAKRLPAQLPPFHSRDVQTLRHRLEAFGPASPYEELQAQNSELIMALDAVTAQQQQLLALNEELEETNRGVMALYSQLSEELEETNRGVVALYAELDDKSQQLQEASEAKSRFLAAVSHELRSPVNSILGLARLLRDADGDPLTVDQAHQVDLIATTATSLLGLINGLLDLAKAESGRLEPVIADVDLRAVFGALRATVTPLVTTDAVRLVIADPPAGLALRSDEQLVTQVLRNLLTNAIKYTERGEVTMSAALDGPGVVITVADTGIGIAPEDQERVFEEFYQVRNPLQSRAKGTGLGLPLVRRITGLLGGEVRLTSTLGQGTAVAVRLPGVAAGPGPGGGRRRVGAALVVDDDPAFRRLLVALLEGRADRVIEAADGREALRQLQGTAVDLLLLDLHLPDLGGQEVLARLDADPALGTPDVVVMTAADLATLPPEVHRLGAPVVAKSALDAGAIDDLLRGARDR